MEAGSAFHRAVFVDMGELSRFSVVVICGHGRVLLAPTGFCQWTWASFTRSNGRPISGHGRVLLAPTGSHWWTSLFYGHRAEDLDYLCVKSADLCGAFLVFNDVSMSDLCARFRSL